MTTAQEEAVETTTGRAKRINTSIVYPSAENDFTMSIDVAVAGTDTVVNFTHKVPEMSVADLRAISQGYANRLGASVASLKDAATIILKLNEEVLRLTGGVYIVKGGGNPRSVFPDIVYAMALGEVLSENGKSYAQHAILMFSEVQGDTDRLSKWLKVWSGLDEDGKKEAKVKYKTAVKWVDLAKSPE
ncbi:hypothetical protein KFZ76_00190 [Methylovulum psychrotolerans]|uniref:hypothetical protein n=1 Tax=Methylovulum psychrotolerans TaxID=1704499 RepID=UPI001BFF80EF|nr:hypothetical protein [Methylovulum psychrotolerans]MBT9096131.1 hypothetical protein [Methylovulum psychrotolerans]